MILEAGIALLGVVTVAFTANYFENKIRKERSKISFKESLDLTQIPVITLQEEDTKLNFLLDSGSSDSYISGSAARMLIGTPVDTDYTYTTSTGLGTTSKKIDSILRYKENGFRVSLYINDDLDNSFNTIKKDSGVKIHGILGSDFLKEHKYVLDFAELVAYHK